MYTFIPVYDEPRHPRVACLLKDTALDCPVCGIDGKLSLLIENRLMKPRFVIKCTRCKKIGLTGRDAYDAIAKWNAPPSLMARLSKAWGKRRKHKSLFFHPQHRYAP